MVVDFEFLEVLFGHFNLGRIKGDKSNRQYVLIPYFFQNR